MSVRSKPDRSDTERLDIIKTETPIFDPIDKYIHWLIPKFIPIAKRARLTPERLGKMIIGAGMTEQKKEVLMEILYNKEVILAWDFTKMRKVKKKVASPQKIQIVDYKTWQVPRF